MADRDRQPNRPRHDRRLERRDDRGGGQDRGRTEPTGSERRNRRRWRRGPGGHAGANAGRRGGVFRQRRPRNPRDGYGRGRSSAGGWIVGLILIAVVGIALWVFLTQVGQ